MNTLLRWTGLVCVGCAMLVSGQSRVDAGNRWASSVGEAKAVQRKTEDLAERLNRSFPYAPSTQMAMQLDNSAAQLVHEVEAGAPWGQIQNSLHRTDAIAAHVTSLVHSDCEVRKDHRVTGYVTEIEKRVDRLRCSLEKDLARARPEICPPRIPVHPRYPVHPMNPGWHSQPSGNWSQPAEPEVIYPEHVQPGHVQPEHGSIPRSGNVEDRWYGSWQQPQYNAPNHSMYGGHRIDTPRAPIGRQILSAVLDEVFSDN